MSNRILLRRFYGANNTTTLGGMLVYRDIGDKLLIEQGWTGRKVLGYKVPDFQRSVVWTDEQCLKFIMSAWLGISLGNFMVNLNLRATEDADMALLDGLQRLTALERYFDNKLVFKGLRWGDLTKEEQAHLLRIPFSWIETSYKTHADCLEAYNLHNFGGTPHTP